MNEPHDSYVRLVRLARGGDAGAARELLPIALRRDDARALCAASAGLLREAFERASDPLRLDLPALASASLSPDGPWLAVAGVDGTVLVYELTELRLAARFASGARRPVAVAMAGELDDGLIATLDDRGELALSAAPDWQRVRPRALAELVDVDELRPVPGFDLPTLLVSMPDGGALVQRLDTGGPATPRLAVVWPRTAGRLLAAHVEAGLSVASDEGLCIEDPDGTERRVASGEARDGERLSFSDTGTRALWLRNGELTWLRFVAAEEPGWQVGAWTIRSGTTLDYFYGHELLDIHGGSDLAPAGAALLHRHEDHQISTWLWDAPGAAATTVEQLDDDLDVVARGRVADTLRLSGDGRAIVACDRERGRVLVRGVDGSDLASVEGFCRGVIDTVTVSPDGRHAVLRSVRSLASTIDVFSLHMFDLERQVVVHTLVDDRLDPSHAFTSFSASGSLAVLGHTGIELWRFDTAGRLVQVAHQEVPADLRADLTMAWLGADRLAISGARGHDTRAIVVASDGRRLDAAEVGGAFVVPDAGIFAPDGRLLQGFERRGNTVAVGQEGAHIIEALPARTTWLVHAFDNVHCEVSTLDVTVHTRRLHRLLTADAQRVVVVCARETSVPIEVLRWQPEAMRLRSVAVIEGALDVATCGELPWLFTLTSDAMIELRHTEQPSEVVARIQAPRSTRSIHGDPYGHTLIARGAGTWLWRLSAARVR